MYQRKKHGGRIRTCRHGCEVFFHHGVDAITLSEYRHTDVGFYVAIMDN